jgi:hypothetical protein
MSQVWTPGAAGPHDDFVRNLHRQVARMGGDAAVSVELADGSLFQLISISSKPGFGFITLQPHPEDEEPMEVVVPVASIAQIRIGKAEPQVRPGFSLPAEPESSTER